MLGKQAVAAIGVGVILCVGGFFLFHSWAPPEPSSSAGIGEGKAESMPASRPANAPLFTLSAQTTAITSPLHADGTPDYVAAMNARNSQGVTPENNAFTAWLAVTGTGDAVLSPSVAEGVLRMSGGKRSSAKWVSFGQYCDAHGHPEKGNAAPGLDEEQQAQLRPWKDGDFPFLAQFLKDRGAVFDQAKEAWRRPRFWIPVVSSDGRSMEDTLLPALGITRDFSTSLLARASYRAGSGDFDGCLSDFVSAKHISTLLFAAPPEIVHLVAAAIESQTAHTLGAVAASGVLTADQCTRLADALGDPSPQNSAQSLDIAERWSILDSALIVATGKTELLHQTMGDAEFRALQSIDVDTVEWDRVLEALNGSMDKELHALQEPLLEDVEADFKSLKPKGSAKRDLSPVAGESREQYTARVAAAMVKIFFPDLSRAEQIGRDDRMQFLMAKALLAAAHHYAVAHRWPASLSELVPTELVAVPIDVYVAGGKDSVHYVVTPKGAALYSVGRNRIDDEGIRDAATHRDDVVIGAAVSLGDAAALP